MDWNYFKARRRTNLKEFVEGCQSESEALQRFASKGLTSPPLEEIKELFAPKSDVPPVVELPTEVGSVAKSSLSKKSVKNATENTPD